MAGTHIYLIVISVMYKSCHSVRIMLLFVISLTEVHRTAAILEGILDELSWPEDAEHILHIQNTLDIIQTGTFRKLASLAERGIATGAKEVCASTFNSFLVRATWTLQHML